MLCVGQGCLGTRVWYSFCLQVLHENNIKSKALYVLGKCSITELPGQLSVCFLKRNYLAKSSLKLII